VSNALDEVSGGGRHGIQPFTSICLNRDALADRITGSDLVLRTITSLQQQFTTL